MPSIMDDINAAPRLRCRITELERQLAEATARTVHIRAYARMLEKQLHACQHNEYSGDHPVTLSLEKWESLFTPTPDPEDDQ